MMKKLFALMLIFLVSMSTVLAVNTFSGTYIDEFGANVGDLQVIAFQCLDGIDCSQLAATEADSEVTVINDNTVSLSLPATTAETYFATYAFHDAYLPEATLYWFNGDNYNLPATVELDKKDLCSSTIDSFSVINVEEPYMPITINVETSLTAETYSAFSLADTTIEPYGYNNPAYDAYYGAETLVSVLIVGPDGLPVSNGPTPIQINLLADQSQTVSFTWTPEEVGEFTAMIYTTVTDDACEADIPQYVQSEFEVIEGTENNYCYTLINDLSISDPNPEVGQTYDVTFEKITNAVDTVLTPLATAFTATIYDAAGNTEANFPLTLTMPANADPTVAEQTTFQWTPASGGNHQIIINGAAQSCPYGTNIDETETILIYVDGGTTSVNPIADANGPYTGQVNQVIQFVSIGSIDPDTAAPPLDNDGLLTYEWDFGDGSPVSTNPNPQHTYTIAGGYTATLTVTDNDGNSDDDTAIVTITDVPPVNQAPTAVINAPATAVVGQVINVDGSGSFDPDGVLVAYEWDFDNAVDSDGDGNPANDIDATGSISPVSYTLAGTYTMSLTVTDDDGAADTATHQIQIIDIVVNQPPVAVINAPVTAQVSQLVTFDGSASFDPDGTITAYEWDLDASVDSDGDGNPANDIDATGTSVTTSYTLANLYTVVLTVTDNSAATDTATHQIQITVAPNVPPVANANGPYSGLTFDPVLFTSVGSNDPDGTIVAYAWDFDNAVDSDVDGNPANDADSVLANPQTIYTLAAVYTVSLTVIDNAGATATDVTTVEILDNPSYIDVPAVAIASATPSAGEPDLFVQFSSAGSSGNLPLSYLWNFGDAPGSTSTLANPTHWYNDEGTFLATLTVTDLDGDVAVAAVQIVVDSDFEEENLPQRIYHVNSIRFVDQEFVKAGDDVAVYTNVDNIGQAAERQGVQIKAVIPELGIMVTSEPFDLKAGKRGADTVFIHIPADTPKGMYTVRMTISDDYVERHLHRDIIVY